MWCDLLTPARSSAGMGLKDPWRAGTSRLKPANAGNVESVNAIGCTREAAGIGAAHAQSRLGEKSSILEMAGSAKNVLIF
jgi:hypothetical protein